MRLILRVPPPWKYFMNDSLRMSWSSECCPLWGEAENGSTLCTIPNLVKLLDFWPIRLETIHKLNISAECPHLWIDSAASLPPFTSITFTIICQLKTGCVRAAPTSRIHPLQTVLSEHSPPLPVKPWPRTPCFPSYPSFFPGAPERGRELRRPHYADCSSARARYIPESWARPFIVLPLSPRSFLNMSSSFFSFIKFLWSLCHHGSSTVDIQ